jgi:TusA-related sulfurtransferase
MTKLSLPELKKQLKTCKTNELISIIMDCYKLSEDVKNYIQFMLEPESAAQQLSGEANDYGDINGPFYYSMESMYQNVLKKIRAERGIGLYNSTFAA